MNKITDIGKVNPCKMYGQKKGTLLCQSIVYDGMTLVITYAISNPGHNYILRKNTVNKYGALEKTYDVPIFTKGKRKGKPTYDNF